MGYVLPHGQCRGQEYTRDFMITLSLNTGDDMHPARIKKITLFANSHQRMFVLCCVMLLNKRAFFEAQFGADGTRKL